MLMLNLVESPKLFLQIPTILTYDVDAKEIK